VAIKVKRKEPSRRQAAKQPDQIYTVSERAFNTLERNKKIVLGGIVAVLVLIVVITLIARMSAKSSQESGAELTSAALLVDAPIAGDGAGAARSFASSAARAEAVRAAVASRVEGSNAPVAARLLDAIASSTLGEHARAGTHLQAVSESDDTPLVAAVSLQGLAASRAAAGDLSSARQALAQLAERMPVLADFAALEEARLAEAAGDLEAALRGYQAVVARGGLVITELGVSQGNEALVETARHRANVLSLLLGHGGEASSANGTGEEGE
jgi:hypothetical protein